MKRALYCVWTLGTLVIFTHTAGAESCEVACEKVVKNTRCTRELHPRLPMCSEVRNYCLFDCREKERKLDRSLCLSRCISDHSCDSKPDSERLACFDSCKSDCGL